MKEERELALYPTLDFLNDMLEIYAQKSAGEDPLVDLITDEFIPLSQDFDHSQIQESWSWRNTHMARELSLLLIDEKGAINRRSLFKAIQLLEKNLYSLGPGRHNDASRQEHLLKILRLFYENQDYGYALKRISLPASNQAIDRLIRETLLLPEKSRLTDAHMQRAAFSALLTSLRQNVGSCFATAPAILIQQDQPLNFLADIAQLMATGRLTRIFEGNEYAVPLSVSWGMGDLFRPVLLNAFGKKPLKKIALSPGLRAAFTAAGLIDFHSSVREQQQTCQKLLSEVGVVEDPFAYITADQLIKAVLLRAFSLTEKEIVDFSSRSVQGPLAEIIIQAAPALGGKSLACSRYLKTYEAAKSAFKALTDNALLKTWEFTLASLSESQADFAKWNLYISLGVQPDELHGIGSSLQQVIGEKIELINQEVTAFQSRYDHLFAQAKYLEGRFSHARSESEAGWIGAEYQLRRHEINRALSERDALYDKGRKLQGIYPILIDLYGKKIRDYFQEVYDAEMHDVSMNPYDDSPAGFRLMYKHGRSNTALWTLVHSATEYIQHLTSFFISTEIELNQLPQFEGLQKELGELVTAAISTIKTPQFLESSFFRLAKAYNEPVVNHPLEHLDKVKRKPWSYIAGGTMATLTSCYWGNPQKPQEAKRWVESENELLAFLIDTLKEAPLSLQRKYQRDPTLSMLAFSPTHAFLCKPGWQLFRKAWESDLYTYTWIRDYWAAIQFKFLDGILLDTRMIDVIFRELLLFIPEGYQAIVKNALRNFSYSMTPPELREQVLKALAYEKWLHAGRRLDLVAEELDSILFRTLPLFPEHQLSDRLKSLFWAIDEVDDEQKKEILAAVDASAESVGKYQILTAEDLKNSAKGLMIHHLKGTRSSIFYHQKIVNAMQKTGLSYPAPLLFADTNWVKNVFGFTINPGTRVLEFWRFDESGSEGRPISQWRRYLNGIVKEEWGLYTAPHQYGQ